MMIPIRALIFALPPLAAVPVVQATPAPAPTNAETSAPDHRLCLKASRRIERAHRIPAGLLGAIGRVESGRWVKSAQVGVAWPWTVYAEGRGRYLPSRQAAKREVVALHARGVTNIDVGCMQINLAWHGDKFADLDEVLDPAANTAYAGRFLAALKTETRTWSRAISRYHSRTPRFAKPYAANVQAMWRKVKREAAEERRQHAQRKQRVRQQAHATAARAKR